ncbi:MBL fold metallo-hydrolase [Winogradskya humida]|uniref:N-acyl homoserine lactonase AttM n=1 Tax=Winogradskya humida TaxID=113566 RepID=A0ABQ4A2M2_9ACTN|nr:MBL fold metallo-hydrolase [Actinoplanes humidus]GIE25093.1 N-acyl homoserine lactonase AttM [Actinoplanes humidus]
MKFDVAGDPLRLHPMIVGYEPIAESLSVLGGDPARYLLEPVTAAAVVYADGWVLLDAGFNVDIVRDPARRGVHFNYDSYTAVVPPGDPLADQLGALGLAWSQLRGCAISHIHVDHTGGLRLVPPGVPVAFQRNEYQYGAQLTPAQALARTVVQSDFLRDDLDIVLLDGDTPLAPGLTALDTSGHTPGHQSFAVTLPSRTVVLACDAADLRGQIVDAVACGTTMRPEDAPLAAAAARRLRDLDRTEGTEVWPGHDPDWPSWLEQTVL